MDIAEELSKLSRYNPSYPHVAMSIQDIIDKNKRYHPNAHMMKIEGFTKLYTNKVKMIESSVFEVCGVKWKVKVYPSGKSNEEDHVSLYLDMEDGEKAGDFQLLLFALHLYDDDKWFPKQLNAFFDSSNTSVGIESEMPFTWLKKAANGLIRSDTAVFGVQIVRKQYNINRPIGTAECVKIVEKPKDNKFTWKITKFSSFNQTDHYSRAFIVGQRKWRILIYPKGTGDQNGNGGLGVFLKPFEHMNNALEANSYVKCKLRVLDQRFGEHRVKTTQGLLSPTSSGYGFRDFIARYELNDKSMGFLMNDTIYIGVEFELISYNESC